MTLHGSEFLPPPGYRHLLQSALRASPHRNKTAADAAAMLRQLDGWFEHQNAVHRRHWGMSPCRFKRQLMEEATETSVYSTMSSGKLR